MTITDAPRPMSEIMIDEPSLKPCPFCAGEAHTFETQDASSEFIAQTQCKGCGAEIVFWSPWVSSGSQRISAMQDVERRWNTRADLATAALATKNAEIAVLVAGLEQIEAGLPAGSTLTAPDSALWRDAYRDLQRIARVALKDAQTARAALEDTP